VTPDDPIARAAADVTGLYTRHGDLWDRVRGPDLRLEAGWMGRSTEVTPSVHVYGRLSGFRGRSDVASAADALSEDMLSVAAAVRR
jgi:hypothetical protein